MPTPLTSNRKRWASGPWNDSDKDQIYTRVQEFILKYNLSSDLMHCVVCQTRNLQSFSPKGIHREVTASCIQSFTERERRQETRAWKHSTKPAKGSRLACSCVWVLTHWANSGPPGTANINTDSKVILSHSVKLCMCYSLHHVFKGKCLLKN